MKNTLRKILDQEYIVKKTWGQYVFLPSMHDSHNLPVIDTQPREAEEDCCISRTVMPKPSSGRNSKLSVLIYSLIPVSTALFSPPKA